MKNKRSSPQPLVVHLSIASVIPLLTLLWLVITFSSCSKSNNLLLGRVEARVGEHVVIVTDCYKTSVPPPQLLKDADAKPYYRFAPCLDADVVFKGDRLIVNGKNYGSVGHQDTVIVDHGMAVVNGLKRQATSGSSEESNAIPTRRYR